MKDIYVNPFQTSGVWYKGNLHTHTTNSDGLLSPDVIAHYYQKSGYDFLSITDHSVLTETCHLSSPDFLMLPGEEICAGISEARRLTHIVGINIEDEIPVEDFNRAENPQKVINLIKTLGGIAIIGHPYWSSLTINDLVSITGYAGIEVYNTTCDLSIARGYSNVHWDDLLSIGQRVNALAVDDAHSKTGLTLPSDTAKAWIMVRAEQLSAQVIVDAIEKGLFYSSNGPKIYDIKIHDNSIHVISSPVKAVAYVSDMAGGENKVVEEGFLRETSYHLNGLENYVRIEITDWEGRKAWTNPIYIKS